MSKRALAYVAAFLMACGGGSVVPGDSGADSSKVTDAAAADADSGQTDGATPRYAIDVSSTSVSGISSGGFMAVQFHVAFSSIMKGAAVFAGGPYMCSQGSLTTAVTSCAQGSPAPDVPTLVTDTKQNATAGAIDDPSALASHRVYIFGGADDTVVSPIVIDALEAYYASFMPSGAIQYVNRRPGTAHTWPTLSYGNPCDVVGSPYLGICNYDGAGAALTQIYGQLNAPAATPGGAIIQIPQGAFTANPAQHSLADTAYAYVPAACSGGDTCKVHVAFHGCLQSESHVSDAFYAHAGLNEWADTNHIIVLYPQTISTGANPEACWDFWGYDSPDFAKKTGPQLAMVRAMLAGLAK